jgi:hypothetical protein
MNKLSYIFDKVLTFFIGLLLGGYFLSNSVDRVIFAFSFAVCLTEALRLLSAKKNPPSDKRHKPVYEHLLLSPTDFPLSLLSAPLEKVYKRVERKGKFIFLDNAKAIASSFTIEPLSPDALIELNCSAQAFGVEKLSVICSSFSPKTAEIASLLRIKLIDYDKLFTVMKKLNCLPDIKEKPPIKKRVKLRKLFSRKRALPLLLCAISLLFFSRFTALSIYYIVSAAACFVLALFSLFLPARD